eukprot:6185794-Pleurochrysis_carterae.AAC.3
MAVCLCKQSSPKFAPAIVTRLRIWQLQIRGLNLWQNTLLVWLQSNALANDAENDEVGLEAAQ